MPPFPPPAAPPFLATFWFDSKTEPMGFEMQIYLKLPENYPDAMDEAVLLLNAYLPLLPPDIHCLKAAITDSDPAIKGDSWIRFFLTGEKSGTFAPTTGADIAPLSFQTGIQQRFQNTTTGVHEQRHIRPIPRTLVADGKTLVPDVAYQNALDDWATAVVAKAVMVTKSPGGSALVSTIDEIVESFHVVRVPGGEPHWLKRGRARTPSVIAANP